jgi:hypothetical protein
MFFGLSISYFVDCLKKRRKRTFEMSGFDVGFVGLFGWRLNIQRKVVVYVTNVEAHVASYIHIYWCMASSSGRFARGNFILIIFKEVKARNITMKARRKRCD